jgi:phosphoribosylamine-glycine ligase
VGLSWARRLHDEGCEVAYYVHPLWQKDIGRNIIPKMHSLHQLLAWAKQKPTIAFFTSSGFGKRKPAKSHDDSVPLGADDFRKAGVPTIGGGSFCDRLEKDRSFGEAIAKTIGCKIPPTKEFSTISQTISFCAKVGAEEWYFKSDRYLSSDSTHGGTGEQLVRYLTQLQKDYGDAIPNILQKKISGVALSTACWWNGNSFVPPYEGTIEHKKFMDNDVGPSTGCALNAVWFYEQDAPKVVRSLKWDNLGPLFTRFEAPPCLYDINAIISQDDGEAYFLEWTPRNGWDSESTSHRLLDVPMCEFLSRLSAGRLAEAPFSTKDLAYSFRLSVSPYPFEGFQEDKGSAKGVPIYGADGLWDKHFIPYSVMMDDEGELHVADRWGLVGLSLATGRNLKACHDEALAYVQKTLEVPSVQYRSDGAKVIAKDAERLEKLRYGAHPGLLR